MQNPSIVAGLSDMRKSGALVGYGGRSVCLAGTPKAAIASPHSSGCKHGYSRKVNGGFFCK